MFELNAGRVIIPRIIFGFPWCRSPAGRLFGKQHELSTHDLAEINGPLEGISHTDLAYAAIS